jgi:hypothetical protein
MIKGKSNQAKSIKYQFYKILDLSVMFSYHNDKREFIYILPKE